MKTITRFCRLSIGPAGPGASRRALDDATAYDLVAVVPDARLTRRDRSLRRLEDYLGSPGPQRPHRGRGRLVIVPDLCGHPQRLSRRLAGNEVRTTHLEPVALEIRGGAHSHTRGLGVEVDHIAWAAAGQAEALALADREAGHALVPAERAPNTLYTGTGQNGQPNLAGTFIYRIYVPDAGRDATGRGTLFRALVPPEPGE